MGFFGEEGFWRIVLGWERVGLKDGGVMISSAQLVKIENMNRISSRRF